MRLRFISAAALAVGVLASTTACASGYRYGDRGGYGRYGGYGDPNGYYRGGERIAYDNGFREGVKQGERDGRGNRRYDPARHGEWRDADDGFRREYGNHDVYRRNFRVGFEQGYSQGYRRYGGYYRR
jgi:hypothetical protein